MKKHFFQTGGLLLLLAAWQIAAVSSSGLVVATPWATFKAAIAYMVNPEFIAHHLCLSLYRMGAALLAAILSGGVLGLISGLFPNVRSLIEPFRWVLTTVPGVVVVMVFMLWFGMGDLMVISIAACMGAPVIYINVADAVALADRELMEMARVYRFPPIMRLVNIYGMAVAGPFFCALVLSAGVTIRVVVLAEVLGANEGIGYYLAIARAQLDTPELYALALISMAVVGGIEYCILRPLERRLIWKGGSNVAQA